MKRLALVATLAVAAACSKADKTENMDTTTPAMAPAPAPTAMDTGMKMDSMKMDSTKMDTTKTKSKS